MPQFRGLGVAIVTPFKNDVIDFDSLERVIEHVISGGVDYIVALGSTGEALLLSLEEQNQVLAFIVQKTNERVPIVAGHFGGNFTKELVRKIQTTDLSGVSAIMSSCPSYVKPTQEGIFQHYMAVAEAAPLPVIIYNVPGRTATNISPSTILKLAKASSKFIAVKEASGTISQSIELIKNKPDNFSVISGDDPSALAHILLGGDGVISVIANALPKPFSKMVHAGLSGKNNEANRLNQLMDGLHHWMYVDGNPAGVKAALSFQDLCTKEVRLPLVSMTNSNNKFLDEKLEQFLLTFHKTT